MIHSFNLNNEEEKQFQKIILKHENKSESAIIRERIFRRRERHVVKVTVVDLKFVSQLSNIISSLKDNYSRGRTFNEDLEELTDLVESKLKEV